MLIKLNVFIVGGGGVVSSLAFRV